MAFLAIILEKNASIKINFLQYVFYCFMNFLCIFFFFYLLFLLVFLVKFVADTFWSTIMLKQIISAIESKNKHIYMNCMWKNSICILEPFSVRRACTKSYVTSQIWCQNMRETWKKKVIKCRSESFARCRVIAWNVDGGGGPFRPPPSLFRVKCVHAMGGKELDTKFTPNMYTVFAPNSEPFLNRSGP